uniref:Endosome-lysosome associated apoptosis and autophagy regulator 1 n=1 Tax=Salmo trutta TaxID=8032 RepID=A0A674EH85_SALTR
MAYLDALTFTSVPALLPECPFLLCCQPLMELSGLRVTRSWNDSTNILYLGPGLEETSDYHFEYTDCDVLGSRWRVAVPNKPDTCTGLPDPVKGTQCTFSCSEGEFLDMGSQECQKCSGGTYSLGTGVAFDEWDSMPAGFISHGMNMNIADIYTNCSNSTWIPKGDYIASNIDECTSTLSYAVSLKKAGTVSFEYFYPDNTIFFEFYVQNDQCESTDSEGRWMSTSEKDWTPHNLKLNRGNNVLYWRTTSFALVGSAVKPVLLRNIAISGVAYTSECFHCKPGTYSAKPGSAHCTPCPADSYSNKGATVCQQCEVDKYAEAGSGSCKQRPACTTSDYFYTHTPCDSKGQTQLMYKWIEPKICSEIVEGAVDNSTGGAVKLPASGQMETCPPCNPGFSVTNTSGCEPCPHGSYSNGTVCAECPVGTEPVVGFEYKWWNKMPDNMRSSVYSREYSDSVRSTEVTLNIFCLPRLPHSVAKDDERSELSRISFVFETQCTADCTLYFMGYSERTNDMVEHWSGTTRKQSYSYLVKSNSTVSFTWGFQRTQVRQYSGDFAKMYTVQITNVVGGVASQCRHCALGSGSASECVPCPPGHYMVNGTGVCKSCPPNTFIRADQTVGEAACIHCGPNTHSNKAHSACVSDCRLDLQSTGGGEVLQYDFTPLANITSFQSSPRFTSKGLRYFHQFRVGLCGEEGREVAVCVDNVTESRKEVRGYACQSTVVPSEVRGQSVQWIHTKKSPNYSVPNKSRAPAVARGTLTFDWVFVVLSSKCSEGTCDGCSFHFLWRSPYACPLCTESHYREIVSACIQGIQRTTYVWQQPLQCTGGVSLPAQTVSACVTLDFWLKVGVSTGTVAAVLLISISCYFWKRTRKLEYKYSKLMMTAGDKECELPAADSCAIMEGEDAEDDLIYLTKKSFFTKIKSFSRERSSDGFDSVPLKSSSGLEMEMS